MAILTSAAEAAAERSRLEALGYVVIDVSLPIGKDQKSPVAPKQRVQARRHEQNHSEHTA